jgi:hypothetical protein
MDLVASWNRRGVSHSTEINCYPFNSNWSKIKRGCVPRRNPWKRCNSLNSSLFKLHSPSYPERRYESGGNSSTPITRDYTDILLPDITGTLAAVLHT